ncbi:MAG TPA: transglutaminaseTgpA domain-containing protein [Actinomycetota bacterium]|nr:transglutaminaseTgpA domain-containing protein [Actinomycetota bacterium]
MTRPGTAGPPRPDAPRRDGADAPRRDGAAAPAPAPPSRPGRRRKALPEDGVAIRVVVACAVEVGIVSLMAQEAVPAATGIAALVLAPLGYWFSFRRRYDNAVVVKILISIALLAALGQFLRAAREASSVDQVREPLATLFLWVQVLHAFDVPRRRDLAFSMVSSTTLVAAAGAVALATSFVWFLLAWAALAAAWLWLSARPAGGEVAEPVALRRAPTGRRARRGAALRSLVAAVVTAVLLATAVFMVTPRLPGNVVRALPFSLGGGAATAATQVYETPNAPPADGEGVVDFAPLAYPGFGQRMDLRARGQLSDEIAFRVRADRAALWRGEAFDTFDGTGWTSSSEERLGLHRGWEGDAATVPPEQLPSSSTGERVTQTFTMATDQPNVVLTAYAAERVYFPAAGLVVDADGAIRSPITLDEGLVYSVVSTPPVTDPAALRNAPPVDTAAADVQRFLQLPSGTSQRVVDLAASLATGRSTQLDVVRAVEAWLRERTRYDLTVPREPAGVDAVDHFLFETRRGFCEHIASAMAILLRANGIPTRLVAGFGPGSRNPFTGYYEVRFADAHAWVEVYYAGIGWVPYDPTFGVPPASPSWTTRFAAPEVLRAVGGAIGRVVPESVKVAAGAAGRLVAHLAGVALGGWPVALLVAASLAAGVVLIRRRRSRSPTGPADEVGRAFEDLVDALAGVGHARTPSETPSEFQERVAADRDLDTEVRASSDVVIRTFEARRFAAPDARPSDADVLRARAAAARVSHLVRR